MHPPESGHGRSATVGRVHPARIPRSADEQNRCVRLLVLGGSAFVGRSVVTAAIDRGWSVTTFNRGRNPWAHPQAQVLVGDRLEPADLTQLQGGCWDAVVDTWAGAPSAVLESATLLAECAGRYLYVSSRAVYTAPTPTGLAETHPTVPASPNAADTDYPRNKRGAELAVQTVFRDRSVLARAGLILGPHEETGRLPYWLLRMARGGRVLAPGPADQPVQYIDVRDLAGWLLEAADGDVSGPVNLVTPTRQATMADLLGAAAACTGAGAELIWVDPAAIRRTPLDRWTELPGWIPPGSEFAGLRSTNTDRARGSGLRCRPVEQTVADTWTWMTAAGPTPVAPAASLRLGLDPVKERAALDEWHDRDHPVTTEKTTPDHQP